jgi:hypothetical protein
VAQLTTIVPAMNIVNNLSHLILHLQIWFRLRVS